MRQSFVVLLLLCACKQSPTERCVSLGLKQTKRAENCGIAAALPDEKIRSQCVNATDKEREEMISVSEYLLGADNCDAFKVRGVELAKRALKKADDEALAKQQEEFNRAFKEALERDKQR